MTAYTREELLLIAAAHATGAASSEEELALHAAVQDDPGLREEVALNAAALEAMAGAQCIVPSDLVRGRLLAQARGAATLQLAPATAQATVKPMRNSVVMAAAAAVFVVLVGMGAEIVRLRAQVAGVTAFNGALRSQLTSRDVTLNRMLTAENHLRLVHMLTGDTVTGPGIQVYWDRAKGNAVLHAFRLPPAPEGRRYQLWAFGDGSPRPLVAFDSDASGHVLISNMEISPALQGIRSLALTVEPAAGSAAPTTDAVVQAEVLGG